MKPVKGSTAWYKAQTKELKTILHETKMEFDISYRRAHKMREAFQIAINAVLWAGTIVNTLNKKYDGFIGQMDIDKHQAELAEMQRVSELN